MSGTVLDHPLVRDYLSELDAALHGLPPGQAGELREQIKAHLDEALPPDAGEQKVAAVLGRLGLPAWPLTSPGKAQWARSKLNWLVRRLVWGGFGVIGLADGCAGG